MARMGSSPHSVNFPQKIRQAVGKGADPQSIVNEEVLGLFAAISGLFSVMNEQPCHFDAQH